MTLASLYSVGEDGVLKSRGTGCKYNIIRKVAHGDRGGLRLYIYIKKINKYLLLILKEMQTCSLCKSLNI